MGTVRGARPGSARLSTPTWTPARNASRSAFVMAVDMASLSTRMGDESRPWVAQQNLLRYFRPMAVATATKIRALKREFKSGVALAGLLGVNPPQITRWLCGAGLGPLHAAGHDLLQLVWRKLRRVYAPEA